MLKITGYADRVSVFPGETIQFMVNCEAAAYEADIVRVVHGDTAPAGPGLKLVPIPSFPAATYPGRPQRIHAGSFGVVPDGPELSALASVSVQAMIQPTTPAKGEQGIITRWDPVRGAGFALVIDENGALALRVGDGLGGEATVSTGRAMHAGTWYFVGASFDAASGEIVVRQEPLRTFPGRDDTGSASATVSVRSIAHAGAPLLFAALFAREERGRIIAGAHYNGRIEAPRLCAVAVDRAAMEQLKTPPLPPLVSSPLLAAWDFSKDISGVSLVDVGPSRLDGYVVNMPARGVVGHLHQVDVHDWKSAPEQWGAIHFHDDDVYDAGWEADFAWKVPDDLPSGVYAARLRIEGQQQHVTFVVRAPRGKAGSKLLYIFPLATYLAYANEHFGTNSALVEMHLNRATVLHPHQVFLNEHREYGHSLYDTHTDGSPVYYSSRFRPILNMQPTIEANHGARPSNLWLFNADTHITDWLEENGFDFDVATDEDLHNEGLGLLRSYRTVMTSTHPEYYSRQMWDGLFAFTESGGRLMYMGGNGFYWRVAFHQTVPGVMEVRRAEAGSRSWEAPTGEYYHSFTGEYGGLWRRQGGRAPNVMCGVGFIAQGFDESSYYVRKPGSEDPRAAFILEGVGADERIGDFGLIGGGAAGMEVDCHNPALGSPPHALVLASSERHSEAHCLVVEEMLYNFMGSTGDVCPQVHADLVFYETLGGGAVFSVGSIAWAGSLSHNGYDNNVSLITKNVLDRFLDETPFEVAVREASLSR